MTRLPHKMRKMLCIKIIFQCEFLSIVRNRISVSGWCMIISSCKWSQLVSKEVTYVATDPWIKHQEPSSLPRSEEVTELWEKRVKSKDDRWISMSGNALLPRNWVEFVHQSPELRTFCHCDKRRIRKFSIIVIFSDWNIFFHLRLRTPGFSDVIDFLSSAKSRISFNRRS